MNCTALVTPPDTKTDTQNIGVPRPSGGWPLSDRWAWSYSLPVSGIARAVAGCIAYHANAKTGLSWPGMGTIAKETGFGRTAIVAAIKVLERGGHVSVTRLKIGKKNTSNRYRLPPMGNVSASHPSAPDGLGPSAPDGPELVRTEQVHTHTAPRVTCERHGRSWYQENGSDCFECSRDRTRDHARPEGHRVPESVSRQHAARSRVAWQN